MKKLIIPIVALMGVSCVTQKEFNQDAFISKYNFDEALTNIQDMKEWMIEDRNNGVIDSTYAEYYIEYLNASEDLLIDFYKLNTNK
tara:strand:+ start:38 stop:295 length:258 start_codon:yes stop_codon:yes gene_type:complete